MERGASSARALRRVFQLLWRAVSDEVGTFLLQYIFQGSFQRSTDLFAVVVVNRETEATDR